MFTCDNNPPAIRPASKSSAVGRCERRGASPVIAIPVWRVGFCWRSERHCAACVVPRSGQAAW
eukprot:13427578-Alexandrium_andersonii.AAC.1